MMTRLVLTAATVLAPACLTAQDPAWMSAHDSSPVFERMAITRPDGQSGPVTGKPFSATEVRHTQQTLADGTHVDHTESSQFYRDAFGRMRTGNDAFAMIFDPVGGYMYTLNLRQKTYQKTAAVSGATYSIAVMQNRTSTSYSTSSDAGGGSARRLQRQGAATEPLSPQFLNGVQAKGSRITQTIPAGTFGNDRDMKVVNERWYSDDLQVLLKSSNSDPRFGVSTYELTNLLQGPPDPSLFVVPADFRLQSDWKPTTHLHQ